MLAVHSVIAGSASASAPLITGTSKSAAKAGGDKKAPPGKSKGTSKGKVGKKKKGPFDGPSLPLTYEQLRRQEDFRFVVGYEIHFCFVFQFQSLSYGEFARHAILTWKGQHCCCSCSKGTYRMLITAPMLKRARYFLEWSVQVFL